MTRLNNKITVIISLAPPDFRPFHRPLRRIRPLLHALSLAETGYAPSIFDTLGHLLCALVFILLFGPFGICRPLCERTSCLLALSGFPALLPRALPVSATSVSENHGESRSIQLRSSQSASSLVFGDGGRIPFPPLATLSNLSGVATAFSSRTFFFFFFWLGGRGEMRHAP